MVVFDNCQFLIGGFFLSLRSKTSKLRLNMSINVTMDKLAVKKLVYVCYNV